MSYRDLVMSMNPSAYWRLGETSGTAAADEVGAYPGTYFNAPTLGQAALIRGSANGSVQFDGVDDMVTMAVADFRSADAQGAVAFWFRTALNQYQYVLSSTQYTTNSYYLLIGLTTNGELRVTQRNNDTADNVISNAAFRDGAIHFGVVQSDGTAYSIYVDNVEQPLTVTSGANSGDWFSDTLNRNTTIIGRYRLSNVYSSPFGGNLDEIVVFNRPLTPSEISALYAAGSVGTHALSGTVKDSSGNYCARRVLAYRRGSDATPSGELVGQTVSHATTGAWSLATPYNEAHTVIVLDADGGAKNALVYDRVMPVAA